MSKSQRKVQHKKSKPRKAVRQRPVRNSEPRLDRHPLPVNFLVNHPEVPPADSETCE